MQSVFSYFIFCKLLFKYTVRVFDKQYYKQYYKPYNQAYCNHR